MKYSQQLVWKAVYEICPAFEVVNADRTIINLPTALKSVAVDLFIRCGVYGSKENFTTNQAYATMIIQDALRELQNEGFMTFGDVNEYWE